MEQIVSFDIPLNGILNNVSIEEAFQKKKKNEDCLLFVEVYKIILKKVEKIKIIGNTKLSGRENILKVTFSKC